eukprot:3619588-Pyramimonas_sp.AAC.1
MAEFFARPRVAPRGRALGLRGDFSLAPPSGWKFNATRLVELPSKLLTLVAFVVSCPPVRCFQRRSDPL